MAITLPPAAAADSYCDIATADAYLLTRLNVTAWDAASDAEKEAALKTATRRLDSEDWKGIKTDVVADNSLRWPRSLVQNSDGQELPSDSVPTNIVNATAELALDLIKAAADESSTAATAPTSEIAVGPIKLKLDTDKEVEGASTVELSGDVETLIEPFRNSTLMGSLVRA